jgi:hypothetical protein
MRQMALRTERTPDGLTVARARCVTPHRTAPCNAQHEPPFPGLGTVLFSIRSPEQTAHAPTSRCAIECPHPASSCGEWASDPTLTGERYRVRALREDCGMKRPIGSLDGALTGAT